MEYSQGQWMLHTLGTGEKCEITAFETRGKDKKVATVYGKTDEDRANADLIALAPELYVAAKCALAALSQPKVMNADIELARKSLARVVRHCDIGVFTKSDAVIRELKRIERNN
tara:strand:+ start:54 stop:395 length:342 start_codon:yes stop_codon:yes gene_type:complete